MEWPPTNQQPVQQDDDLHPGQSDAIFEATDFLLNTEHDNHKSTGTSIMEAGSIYDLNGRTYQGYREGKYFLPNDPTEQDRLDFQHAGLTILLGDKLSWAPFTTPPRNVLDVATGTGLWAMDFARMYPAASVVGSDLFRIQPGDSKPDDCKFVQEDVQEPWVRPKNHFDYVHFRLTTTCFDRPQTARQHAYESLVPGGWVEGAAAMGREIQVARHHKEWLVEAGCEFSARPIYPPILPQVADKRHLAGWRQVTDVQEHQVPWPMNGWHQDPRIKEAGRYMQRMLLDNARGMAYKVPQGRGHAPAEIESQINQCKEEFRDESILAFVSSRRGDYVSHRRIMVN